MYFVVLYPWMTAEK